MTAENIKKYLKSIKNMLSNNTYAQEYYSWILKYGKGFGKLIKLEDIKEIIKEYRHSTELKECYYNSQMMAINSRGKIDYYEGWYITSEFQIPLEHGFNVHNGSVIDTTAFGKFGVDEYFGVRIPNGFIAKNMLKTGMAENLLQKYYKEKERIK